MVELRVVFDSIKLDNMHNYTRIQISLFNLYFDHIRKKDICYNRYFINGYAFHTEEYGEGKNTYISGVCIKESTSNEFDVNYYCKLEEVIELQYNKA